MKRLIAALIAIGFLAAPAAAFALQQSVDGEEGEKTTEMNFEKGEDLTGTHKGPGGIIDVTPRDDGESFRLTRANFVPELLDSANQL
jgi:hypothetical protein